MNVLDLEEAEGLTAQLVRAYLERKGWSIARKWRWPCDEDASFIEDWKQSGCMVQVVEQDWGDWKEALAQTITKLAAWEGRSVQALMREMAPRLVLGVPPKEARDAHAGTWIARKGDALHIGTFKNPEDILTFEVYHSAPSGSGVWREPGCSYRIDPADGWSFWPVNENGDRVPMPACRAAEVKP